MGTNRCPFVFYFPAGLQQRNCLNRHFCGCYLLRSLARPVGDIARRSKPSAGAIGVGFSPDASRPVRRQKCRWFESSRGSQNKTARLLTGCFVLLSVESRRDHSSNNTSRLLSVAEPSAPSGRYSSAEQAKRGSDRSGLQPRRIATCAQAVSPGIESSRESQKQGAVQKRLL